MSHEDYEYKACCRASTLKSENAIDLMINKGSVKEIRTDILSEEDGEDRDFQTLKIWGQIIGKNGLAVPHKALKLVKVICEGGTVSYEEIARTWSNCEGSYAFTIDPQCDSAYYKVIVEESPEYECWAEREDEIRPCPARECLQKSCIRAGQSASDMNCHRADSVREENGIDIIMKNGDVDEVRTDIVVDSRRNNRKCRMLRIWGRVVGTDGFAVPNRPLKLVEVVWEGEEAIYEEITHTWSDCEGWYEFAVMSQYEQTYYKVIVEDLEE